MFEKDLFISYAHDDNEVLVKSEKGEGWVSSFHYALKRRLDQLLRGRDPQIWRDDRLRGDDFFDEEICSQFPKVKALLAVLSPSYIDSVWCKKELDQFIAAAEQNLGFRIGNKSRVFKIMKTPVALDEHPEPIRDLLGYAFYEEDDTGRFREFTLEKGSAFWDRFEDVAQDLSALLSEINKLATNGGSATANGPSESGSTEPSSAVAAAPEKTVYLAETTSALNAQRDDIRRNLQEQGYTILPDPNLALPFFLKDGKFRDVVADYLQKCKLSIHLVGGNYGPVPEGEQQSTDQIQYEQASNGKLARLIWTPPDLKISDDKQQQFVADLRNDSGAQIIEKTKLEDFKSLINDTLEKLNRPQEEKANPPAADGPKRVYLIYDRSDKDAIKSLDNYLYDEVGLEVLKSVFEGSVDELRKLHQERLEMCDGVIIYHGHANELWLNTKLDDIRRVGGTRSANPFRAKAVFVGGEKTGPKEDFRTREALVIKHFGDFASAALTPFVSQLQNSEGGAG